MFLFEQAGMIRKPSQKKKKREQAAAVQNRFFPKSNCAGRILNAKESLGSGSGSELATTPEMDCLFPCFACNRHVFFVQMAIRTHVSLILLLTFTCSALAQSKSESSAPKGALERQSGSTSKTYTDTLRMIKAWLETEENDELARLFAIGDVRVSDLMTACHSTDEKIAEVALLTLQLLGKSECESCPDSISRKHYGLALACAGHVGDADFKRIQEWWAKKRTLSGYQCGKDYEPLTEVDDSLVYALILDGSPRSKSVLDDMLAFEKACAPGHTTITGEILEQAQSLIAEANEIGRDLKFDPNTLENSIRASAFCLPLKYRKDSDVEVIAHSKTDDRILLEVSYRCGMLCGRGYYVVLRKDGTVWQYAVIRMAWIS